MPQMVALFNGMGGGSAAAIGAVELLRTSQVLALLRQPQVDLAPPQLDASMRAAMALPSTVALVLAVVGALIARSRSRAR